MTSEEMLAELAAICAGDNNRDGFWTTEELATAAGLTKETMRARLHLAESEGRLEVRKWNEVRLGRNSKRTGYRILPA